jgi:hypothetical protein
VLELSVVVVPVIVVSVPVVVPLVLEDSVLEDSVNEVRVWVMLDDSVDVVRPSQMSSHSMYALWASWS